MTDPNSSPWSRGGGGTSMSSDVARKVHDTPYSRSISLVGGGTSIFWGPGGTPAQLDTKYNIDFHNRSASTRPSPIDVKLFVPFLQPPNNICNRVVATPHDGMLASSFAMIAPHSLESVPMTGSNKNGANLHASLHNLLVDMSGGCGKGGGGSVQGGVPFLDQEVLNSGSGLLTPGADTKEHPGGEAGGEPQRVYRCDYCSKTFLFRSKYHEHLPVHTSARPFQCHLCSRTYKYKYDLRVHLRTHLGTVSYLHDYQRVIEKKINNSHFSIMKLVKTLEKNSK